MPPDRCQADADCRQLTELASSLASQGQYEEALATYQRAYERVPEPRLLVNLGRCHFRLGRPQKALGLYRALQNAMPTLPPELDTKVKQFIAEAEDVINKDSRLAPSLQRLPPPAASPGKAAESQPERPADRDPEKPLARVTEPTGVTVGPTVSAPSVPAWTSPARASDASAKRPAWRIALGATGLALGAAAVGVGAWALSVDGQCITESTLFPGRCLTTSSADGQRTAQVRDGLPAGVGFLLTGGALLVTGAVLIALPGRRSGSQAALRPRYAGMALSHP